jgi:YidC/Oxa1 family membrane protein insertase
MDRNQVIGFSLLALLLVGYISYNQYEQKKFESLKKTDSATVAHLRPKIDSIKAPAVAQVDDSATIALRKLQPAAYNGVAQTVTLENKKVAISFSTKGGFPTAALLKEYKTYGQQPLYVFNGTGNMLNVVLPFDNGKATESLYFTPTTRDEADGGKTIDFSGDLGNGKKVDIVYTLPANDYMMRCNVVLTGMPAQSVKMTWLAQALHSERDIATERQNTQVYYHFKDDDNDYFTVRNNEEKTFSSEHAVTWVGFRKQYFSSALICDEGFSKISIKAIAKPDDSMVVAQNSTEFIAPLKAGSNEQALALKWYIGPNDYNTLKGYKIGLDDMVPLGYGIMSFVKYINRGILIPIFYFLASFISNYAIIIMLMTIFIRLILSFFTYKSYLSSAKMRILKPELDELRAKIGDDQQKMGVEQMKLYKEAGVNPLGGCLPMLFQLPILLSMYYMFPSFIEFRQKSFLWAHDLSTYDSILSWTTNIPILSSVYGNHISLFTLMMTASSLFLAIYNRNMTPQDPNNPMMKYMPYIFPVILMGVFNKMAAALTFYYTFSNILSITQQFVIQKFFINEEAIHAQIKENRSKPASASKWQQKLQEMQAAQADKTKVMPRTNKK